MITRTPLSRRKTVLYPLWISFLLYTWVTQDVFVILAILIMVDYLLGITRAVKTKKKVTSKKMRVWLIWKLSLLLIPLTLWLSLSGAWIDATRLVTASWWALLLSECFSIIQHIHIISTGNEIEEYDATSYVIKKLLKGLKNILEKFL